LIEVKKNKLKTESAQSIQNWNLVGFETIQGTLVPKQTLGPFLTLSVRHEHKLKDWVFGIPAHIKSKSR